ncbi:MAG: Uma2 family endonuclease [Planctomycetota bacterium]
MLRPIKKTVEDYLAYDEERVELINGEFLVSPSPCLRHQRICGNLFLLLELQARKLGIGQAVQSPFDTVLSVHTVVQADIVFMTPETLKRADPRLEGPPDVAIEILSKSGRKRDLVTKKKLYHEFRIPEYWIVDPVAETVRVLVWSEKGWNEHGAFKRGESATSVVMKGVLAPVAEIFE